MQKIIGISLAVLATILLAGTALAITVTNPPSAASGSPTPVGSPILSVSFQVKNDEDSGVVGYWALDDYTKTITVWHSATPGTDVAYVGYTGTFCTFAGAKSPMSGVVQTNDGCGTMTAGKDVTLTYGNGTYPTPAYTSSPASPEDILGTKADILNGTYANQEPNGGTHVPGSNDAAWDWVVYYFPTATKSETAWSFTYTLKSGTTASWVNSNTAGNYGDIVADSTSATAAANVICNTNADCPNPSLDACVNSACVPKVCGLSATGGIQFGSMVPGATVQSADTTTVANTGNVPVTPSIYGANWVGSQYPTSGSNWMPVESTSWSIGSGWHQLTNSAATMGTTLNPYGTATVYYELTVPSPQPTDTYTQVITFSAGC